MTTLLSSGRGRLSARSIRVLCAIISSIFLLYLFHTRHSPESRTPPNALFDQTEGGTAGGPVDEGSALGPPDSALDSNARNILDQMEKHRQATIRWTEADYARVERRMGMSPDTLPRSKSAYYRRLERILDKWFEGSSVQDELRGMLRDFEARDMRLQPLPQWIVSTDKGGWRGTPEGFEIWAEVATREDGWTVEVLDDETLGMRMRGYTLEGEGARRVAEIWDRLEFPVLKSDLIRYTALLLDGGIYTDSDTVPRAHPYSWGSVATDISDPLLSMLDSNLAFLRDLQSHLASSRDKTKQAKGSSSPTILNPDVSVVLSLEDNRWDEGDEEAWTGGHEVPYRRLSMCQWTMMSKKSHPIMLDAMGTALDNLEAALSTGKLDGSIGAPQLTGPPVFTDAVLRYLLVQHGITPLDLVGVKTRQAVRAGDVIVYGPGSFGPMYKTRADHTTGDVGMPVGHMFKGRWKEQGWD